MPIILQPLILPHHRKKDGTNIVRIRLTHRKQSRWIKTNVVIYPKDTYKDGRLKNHQALRPAYDLIDKMNDVVAKLDTFRLKSMSVDDVVRHIEKALEEPGAFRLDFIEYGMGVAQRKSEGNRRTYIIALNALLRFFSGRHPDISEITVRNLRSFEQYINGENVVKVDWRKGKQKTIKKKKGGRAASLYLSNIRHIYKSARLEYNDPDLGLFPIPVDPFEYYSLPKTPASRHRDISPDTIQLMIDTRRGYSGRVRMAIDAFLISFGLCGMNAADLFSCSKPKKGILYYQRQKTSKRRDDGAEMFLKIEPCIAGIMQDYSDGQRCFDYYKRYKDKDIFTTALNQGLRRWIKDNGQEDFTFYSARHSWATIGRSKRCGIGKDIIAVGLCHIDESNRTNDIYINTDWELLWDANKIILDSFKWDAD